MKVQKSLKYHEHLKRMKTFEKESFVNKLLSINNLIFIEYM